MGHLTKVLVANRGEIACRIFEACKKRGIGTVAVYSDADANSKHVRVADEKVRLGPGPAVESYLNIDAILSAAKKTKANGIHPGYGFLSERAHFAEAVINAGLIWIGPSPDVIDKMGSKIQAKLLAEKAGVPTLPWALVQGLKTDDLKEADLIKTVSKIGYPVLIKAAAGGGGRGMRLVTNQSELYESAVAAMREALSAFGSGELFLEAYKEAARHVEVQIIGDTHGNVYTFGERDCTAQRRHQKVLEEAPAPNLSDATRQSFWAYAKSLGKEVGYQNAGTCEFLYDQSGKIYFLEMNTRLQVEHPVTELVWGVDLVSLQLDVADGKRLPRELDQKTAKGHAIEARLYAESPSKGFMPSPGDISRLSFPTMDGLRVDSGYESGDVVPIYYDAMLAKLICYGTDRKKAVGLLREALLKSKIKGVDTNKNFLFDLLSHRDFNEFCIDTKWIERTFKEWTDGDSLAAVLPSSPWVYFALDADWIKPKLSHQDHLDEAAASADSGRTLEPLISEYPGKVLSVKYKAGDVVKADEVIVVCESMKMEFNYTAPAPGKIKAVLVKPGDIITAGTLLVEWEQ
jgi:acetyl/propionyl-CoA carboxylase alpha subunit